MWRITWACLATQTFAVGIRCTSMMYMKRPVHFIRHYNTPWGPGKPPGARKRLRLAGHPPSRSPRRKRMGRQQWGHIEAERRSAARLAREQYDARGLTFASPVAVEGAQSRDRAVHAAYHCDPPPGANPLLAGHFSTRKRSAFLVFAQ